MESVIITELQATEAYSSLDLSIYLSICLPTYEPTYLQSFVGPCPLFGFLICTQSVGFLGLGISPPQGLDLYTEQHKRRINAHGHSCLEWNSNPRSQCTSGRRLFMPYRARSLWSAEFSSNQSKIRYHYTVVEKENASIRIDANNFNAQEKRKSLWWWK
jgi:hypothetical protein